MQRRNKAEEEDAPKSGGEDTVRANLVSGRRRLQTGGELR